MNIQFEFDIVSQQFLTSDVICISDFTNQESDEHPAGLKMMLFLALSAKSDQRCLPNRRPKFDASEMGNAD